MVGRPGARASIGHASLRRTKHSENRGGKQELQACWERTGAVPAPIVEEFPSPRAQEGEDVLEVGRGTRGSPKRCRVERAASRGEKENAPDAAADLERPRVEVSVRHAVSGNMESRPQKDCCQPRSTGSPRRSARRKVVGNYHAA